MRITGLSRGKTTNKCTGLLRPKVVQSFQRRWRERNSKLTVKTTGWGAQQPPVVQQRIEPQRHRPNPHAPSMANRIAIANTVEAYTTSKQYHLQFTWSVAEYLCNSWAELHKTAQKSAPYAVTVHIRGTDDWGQWLRQMAERAAALNCCIYWSYADGPDLLS